MAKAPDQRVRKPQSNLPRFTIAGLLILMLISTVAASGASYLWSAANGERLGMVVFFPFILIVPFALMIGIYWLLRVFVKDDDSDETQYLG